MAICITLILAMIDFTETCIMECDTFRLGMGATSMQERSTICFQSYQLKGNTLVKPFKSGMILRMEIYFKM
jgi:hypothetical protein